MSLLKQDITRIEQKNENNKRKLDVCVNETCKYKVRGIEDSIIYMRESESENLSRPYYLIFEKDYLKKENI